VSPVITRRYSTYYSTSVMKGSSTLSLDESPMGPALPVDNMYTTSSILALSSRAPYCARVVLRFWRLRGTLHLRLQSGQHEAQKRL